MPTGSAIRLLPATYEAVVPNVICELLEVGGGFPTHTFALLILKMLLALIDKSRQASAYRSNLRDVAVREVRFVEIKQVVKTPRKEGYDG